MSKQFLEELNKLSVEQNATAGEAHWQSGIAERMSQTLWNKNMRIMAEQSLQSTAKSTKNSKHKPTPCLHIVLG